MKSQVLVIFGSTGDLCFNKLLPSLATMIQENPLALDAIVLVGRQVKSIKEYEKLALERGLTELEFSVLAPKLHFVYMQSTDAQDYKALVPFVQPHSHRYFYVATTPGMYAIILEHLTRSTLFEKHQLHHRIAFEKPFGENATASTILNSLVHLHGDERQIFRVDHYLAKALIRDLLPIRTELLTWNDLIKSSALKKVVVTAFETLGILSRGKFYDQTGAIHDMIQSHLLETLALAIMPLPSLRDVRSIQQAKLDFFNSLSIVPQSIQLGQYEGYRREIHVSPDSMTETFARVCLSSNIPSLHHVDMVIQTGKRLSKKLTEIKFIFDRFTVLFNISPLLKIKWMPHPGESVDFQSVLPFRHLTFKQEEAYVKIFKDFISGDQTLFPSALEIEATWKIVDQIKLRQVIPQVYQHEKDILGEHDE